MDTLTSLSWYFSNTLPAIFFTIKMHYSEMERCWGSRFFQHVLHSFNTDFFIARKLLSNVNKQLNKAIGPSSLTAKCSQRGKGIGKTKCWSWVLLYCRKLCSKQEKNLHATKVFHYKSTNIIHISEQCPLAPAAAAGTEQNQAVLC